MAEWFNRNFDAGAAEARSAVDDIRHALLGGWFGRNFEPHPTRQQNDLGWTRDDGRAASAEPLGPERDHGLSR
jgi:hypothetical protein